MARPTPAALILARSTPPVRRVASASPLQQKSPFASLLQNTPRNQPRPQAALLRPASLQPLDGVPLDPAGPAPTSRGEIVARAEQLLAIPNVWGGNTSAGLDCSAFVSKAWGVGRQTTDSLASVARPIARDQLQAGDALNLTTARDADGTGHVRRVDSWANADKTRLWVYEETPPRSIHHVIDWDPSYTPLRRVNTVD